MACLVLGLRCCLPRCLFDRAFYGPTKMSTFVKGSHVSVTDGSIGMSGSILMYSTSHHKEREIEEKESKEEEKNRLICGPLVWVGPVHVIQNRCKTVTLFILICIEVGGHPIPCFAFVVLGTGI